MRRTIRSVGVVFAAMLAVLGLAIASAFSAALAFGAVALIVPGTGTPNANVVAGYRQNARDYYLGTTPCNNAANCPDANLTGINYPASFFPLAFIPNWCVPGRCNKWNDSVGQGVSLLNSTLMDQLTANPNEDIVLFGYSQGSAVVSNELRTLGGLTPEQKSHLSVVQIGSIDTPDGGLFTRLGFLGTVPFFDVTTGLTTPVDTGIKLTTINFEYDGVGDFPRYGGNLLADLNAIAGFAYIHGTYLEPNMNSGNTGLPDGYTPPELLDQQNCATHPANCRYDSYGNTYITIPSPTLPLVMPLLDLGSSTGTTAIVKPLVDLISPTLRVLIDLGYDRSVDPGVLAQLSILPFNPLTFNPVKLTFDLINAAIQGVQAAAGDLGGATLPSPFVSTPSPLAVPATTPQKSSNVVSLLSAKNASPTANAAVTKSKDPVVSGDAVASTNASVPGAPEVTPATTGDQGSTAQTGAAQGAQDQTGLADQPGAGEGGPADKGQKNKGGNDKGDNDKGDKDTAQKDKGDKSQSDKSQTDKGQTDKGQKDKADKGKADTAGSDSGAGDSDKKAAA